MVGCVQARTTKRPGVRNIRCGVKHSYVWRYMEMRTESAVCRFAPKKTPIATGWESLRDAVLMWPWEQK